MTPLRRALLAGLLVWCLGAALPVRAHHRSVLSEQATLTYYLPTGSPTMSGLWPSEGWTVGCGWEVPVGALATFSDGSTFLCADKGATWGPWIDFFATSAADGQALVYGHAERCPYACYATVEFSW